MPSHPHPIKTQTLFNINSSLRGEEELTVDIKSHHSDWLHRVVLAQYKEQIPALDDPPAIVCLPSQREVATKSGHSPLPKCETTRASRHPWFPLCGRCGCPPKPSTPLLVPQALIFSHWGSLVWDIAKCPHPKSAFLFKIVTKVGPASIPSNYGFSKRPVLTSLNHIS